MKKYQKISEKPFKIPCCCTVEYQHSQVKSFLKLSTHGGGAFAFADLSALSHVKQVIGNLLGGTNERL